MPKITSLELVDIRFPTSLNVDGSDAMTADPDYSAAYVRLTTDDPAVYGCGFTFTIGRGNEVCLSAIRAIGDRLIGRPAAAVHGAPGDVYREFASDSQLRWLGPEKGVIHLAMAAVMNAVWDMASRSAGKPLWRYVAEMSPEEIVEVADLTYLEDALTREEALAILRAAEPFRADRIAQMKRSGYPCYTTSPGWLGYSDEKMVRLAREAVREGYRHVKLKVGADLERDKRRLRLARDAVGPDIHLMIDANQVWSVPEAIRWIDELSEYDLHWVEEPTSPDDILGHATIRRAVQPKIATGEHGMNRVLFKQMLQAGAIDFLQLDSCRLASINEILAVYLLAAKFGVPVCPHAGGVGLCELVNHLVMIDFIAISGSTDGRVAEYVDHLHEHFVTPCVVSGGAYTLPARPGYSAEMTAESLATFAFPEGIYWSQQFPPAGIGGVGLPVVVPQVAIP